MGRESLTLISSAMVEKTASMWTRFPGNVHKQSPTFQAGALIELSGDVDTAFEIYYETYDIHELLASSAIPQRNT